MNAICKYENHPNVISIKNYIERANSFFACQTFSKEKIEKLVASPNNRKAV